MELSEKTFEELYSKADILYFLLDAQANILSCNITVEEKLHYEKNECVGKKFLTLIPENELSLVDDALLSCFHKGYLKDIEMSFRTGQGQLLHARLNGLGQYDFSGNVQSVRLYARDISELVQNKMERDFLLKVLAKVQSGKENNRKIKEILNDIQIYSGSEGIGLFLQERDGKPLNLVTWKDSDVCSPYENDFRKWDTISWKRMVQEASGASSAHYTQTGSFWTESLSDLVLGVSGMEEKDALVSLSNFESIAIIPIPDTSGHTHFLVGTHRQKNRWNEHDVLFLESAAALFGYLKSGAPTPFASPSVPSLDRFMDVPFIGVFTVHEEKIIRTNAWIEEWTGYANGELNGKLVFDLFAPESVVPFREWIAKLGELGSGVFDQELVVISKDGSRRSVFASVSRTTENNQALEIWYWTPKPEQTDFKEQWIHAKRMEYMGMLAGSLVLDFNNLLSCILGYTSLLSEEISKDSPNFEDLQQISKTAEKATELTSRLLASSQGTPYIMDDLDANILINEVAAYLSKTVNKRIVIRAELDHQLGRIHADASQLQQAILQVALNARDAMPNGGKLFFQTRNYKVSEADAHLHAGSQPGEYIQINVSDTGLGMTQEIKERFFRQNASQAFVQSGKAFGLTLVKQIVENHKGFISVFSETGKGTLFKMHFPVSANKKSGSNLRGGKPVLGKETILLVDDERPLMDTARKMLTRYGYKVIAADNGTEAVAIYKKHIDRIHLIILDPCMPGMEIHKVMTWFKKLNPRVKILASIGPEEKEGAEKTVGRNVIGYVHKPFQLRPLLESIRNVLNA